MLKDRTNNGISLIERANRIPFIVAGISRCLEYSNKWNKSINGLAFLQIIYKLLCDVPSRPRFFSLSLSLSLSFSTESRSTEYRTTRELRTCSFITKLECTMERKCVNDNFSTIFPQCSRSYTNFFKSSRSIDRSIPLSILEISKRTREREREKKILSEAFVLTSIKSIRVDAEMHDIVISFMNDKLRSKPWILSNVFNARDCN